MCESTYSLCRVSRERTMAANEAESKQATLNEGPIDQQKTRKTTKESIS